MTILLHPSVRPGGPFRLEWSLHPSVLLGALALGLLYCGAIGPWRRRGHLGPAPSAARVVSFVAGLSVLLGSLNGPIHELSDYYLFSIHMVQHLLLTLVLPPLLIYGLPGWLVDRVLGRPTLRGAARILARPLVAGGLFSATLVVWHTVPLYDLMMRDHDVHVVTHLLFMVAAVIMWWPVMSPTPVVPRLSAGMQLLYLFLVGIPMQLVAALITFSDSVLYRWYQAAPRTWGLSTLDDQRLGGLLMWVPGSLWMWGAMSIVFFQWARREGETEKRQRSEPPDG